MRTSFKQIRRFGADERGAVTVDWVALTAAVVIIGVGLSYAIMQGEDGTGGLAGLAASLENKLGEVTTNLDNTSVPGTPVSNDPTQPEGTE